jgi:hypothetical protein
MGAGKGKAIMPLPQSTQLENNLEYILKIKYEEPLSASSPTAKIA